MQRRPARGQHDSHQDSGFSRYKTAYATTIRDRQRADGDVGSADERQCDLQSCNMLEKRGQGHAVYADMCRRREVKRIRRLQSFSKLPPAMARAVSSDSDVQIDE